MDSSYLWLAPIALIAVLILIGGLLLLSGIRFRTALKDAADKLSMSWEDGGRFAPGSVTGSLHGEAVDIFTSKVGSGSFERLLTVIEIDLNPPLDAEFQLGKENVLSKLSHTFGVHDFEFGDKAFDDVFRVTGADPDELEAIFTPEARASLVAFAGGADDVRVTPARLRWEKARRVTDGDLMVQIIQAGVAAAKAMRTGLGHLA